VGRARQYGQGVEGLRKNRREAATNTTSQEEKTERKVGGTGSYRGERDRCEGVANAVTGKAFRYRKNPEKKHQKGGRDITHKTERGGKADVRKTEIPKSENDAC